MRSLDQFCGQQGGCEWFRTHFKAKSESEPVHVSSHGYLHEPAALAAIVCRLEFVFDAGTYVTLTSCGQQCQKRVW